VSFSISLVKAEIWEYLDEEVFPGQTVHTQTIPDTTILERNNAGKVKPYVAFQMGDIRYAGNETFAGVRSADYVLPIKGKIVVAGEDYAIGDKLRDQFYNRFYGAKFEWAGNIRPLSGIAGEFPLRKSDGATEAIIIPVGVGIVTQFLEVEEVPVP